MKFFCDIDYDPFSYMQENEKVYGAFWAIVAAGGTSERFLGFTISLYEWEPTIPTLWDSVKGKDTAVCCAEPTLITLPQSSWQSTRNTSLPRTRWTSCRTTVASTITCAIVRSTSDLLDVAN